MGGQGGQGGGCWTDKTVAFGGIGGTKDRRRQLDGRSAEAASFDARDVEEAQFVYSNTGWSWQDAVHCAGKERSFRWWCKTLSTPAVPEQFAAQLVADCLSIG